MMIKAVCVFCGSNVGRSPSYLEAAQAMGSTLARQGIELVYGGGAVGLMGSVADAVLAAGGKVTGVIPESLLNAEIGHAGLTRLEVVQGMHARKARMAELADAFIALPGGLGTFEELFEVWTWGQLGYHRKPIGLLKVGTLYDPLLSFLDRISEEGFVRPEHRDMLQCADTPEDLLRALSAWQPPRSKWE